MNKQQEQKLLRSIAVRENNLQIRQNKVNMQAAQVRKDLKTLALATELKEMIHNKFKDSKVGEKPKITSVKKKDILYVGLGDDQHGTLGSDVSRITKVFAHIKDLAIKRKAKHIVIIHLGDNVEGSNRPSSHINLRQLIVQQSIEYANATMNALIDMTQDFNVDFYMTTVDNHGELRMVGGPGEQPHNNILNSIANQLVRESRYVKRLNVVAKPIFYGEKIPGGYMIAGGHGNIQLLKAGAGLNKFVQLKDRKAMVLLAHTHHFEIVQEVTYDRVTVPAIKEHTEPYEVFGAWAQYDNKKEKSVRRGQYVELEFTTGVVGETRVAMVRLHTV